MKLPTTTEGDDVHDIRPFLLIFGERIVSEDSAEDGLSSKEIILKTTNLRKLAFLSETKCTKISRETTDDD